LGGRRFLWKLSGDGTEIRAPVTADFWAPMTAFPLNWGAWRAADTALVTGAGA